MLNSIFLNPEYLIAGGAAVSAPIIIHLINRMRFRRLRWAAMEFLLKSQKRMRRRLIIEQLLLLALRCLLVMLVALVLLRFLGAGLAGFVRQVGFHLVVIDDTLSMNDQHDQNRLRKTAFDTAVKGVILERLFDAVSQSSTNERIAFLPLSKLAENPDFQPKVFQNLGEDSTKDDVANYLNRLKATQLHVPLALGVERAEGIFADHADKRQLLHIVSDFRRHDWTGPESNKLHAALRSLADKHVKTRLLDAAHPYRQMNQGGIPLSHDNIAVTDFRANTRVVGKGKTATFSVEVTNLSPNDKEIYVVVYNDETGNEIAEVDFNPPMPMKVKANSAGKATFDIRLFPEFKGKQKSHSQRLSVRLESAQRGPLDDDGLQEDNVRHAGIEVREKVPILLVDGLGRRGLEEGKDSFHVSRVINAFPGGALQVVFAHDIVGGKAVKVLERNDLNKYPSIFLLNVRELTDKQHKNLENYVREGGGVAFFLGPQVDAKYYNKKLYRRGEGIFPAPLEDTYYPKFGLPKLKREFTGDPHMVLRKDQFKSDEELPVFGKIFRDDVMPLLFFSDLYVFRYFKVPRSAWRADKVKHPGRMYELGTLPNDKPAGDYRRTVIAFTNKLPTDDAAYQDYAAGLRRHKARIRNLVAPNSEATAYQLGDALKEMLEDRGDNKQPKLQPNMTAFWSLTDPKIRDLKKETVELYEDAQFGDPFIALRNYGKGKVLAMMSTAGKETRDKDEWNYFAGGTDAAKIYPLFIWYANKWLSSQGSEATRYVGQPISINVDVSRYKKQGIERVQMVRTYFPAKKGEPGIPQKGQPLRWEGADGQDTVAGFTYAKNFKPGFYLFELFPDGAPAGSEPLLTRNYVFNVDALREGKLQRVSGDEMRRYLAAGEDDVIAGPLPPDSLLEELVNRQTDLSEFTVLFLMIFVTLVCEQALAVHLSFHMRAREAGQLPTQAAASSGSRAA